MAFTVLSDKASHFLDVTRCDQWGLLYGISTQRCLWDMNSCQTELPRLSVPPLKQTFAFATHALLFQIVFTQTALLRIKKNPCQGWLFYFKVAKNLLRPQSCVQNLSLKVPFIRELSTIYLPYLGFYHSSSLMCTDKTCLLYTLYKVKHNGYKNECLIIVNSLLIVLCGL